MNITPRFVNTYGYVFLVVVIALCLVVWLQLVPRSMYIPLFLVALVLYLVRITLRLVLERQRRVQQREGGVGSDTAIEEKKEEE
jgi:hypothetical protein